MCDSMSNKKNRRAGGFFVENDLQEDGAGEVFARLCVDDFELDVFEYELLDVRERDVTARRRVVQAAIRILLDDAHVAHSRCPPAGRLDGCVQWASVPGCWMMRRTMLRKHTVPSDQTSIQDADVPRPPRARKRWGPASQSSQNAALWLPPGAADLQESRCET